MDTENKNVVSAVEIEEKVEKMEEEKNNTEGHSFAPLSAQDLAVCCSFYF